ncbi:MAG TPA: DUF983 domain-containing protein [Dongiaceae bacterium]|jgi:uncharacterized protein (DUF983 family)|nr:DUF983 domain-containing protein [Dongiaceae bacterium]
MQGIDGQGGASSAAFSLAIRARCPRCGRGRLYRGVLALRSPCEICGLDLTSIDAGDGAAAFAIFALGALLMPLVLWLELAYAPPLWVHAVLWVPITLLAAVAILRPIKAFLMVQHYRHVRDES